MFECVFLYVILHLHICVNKCESEDTQAREPLPMSFILLRPQGGCAPGSFLSCFSHLVCVRLLAPPPSFSISARGERRGGKGGWDEERKNCSLPHSLGPFPGFVRKLLGRQCHPAALLSQEKGAERLVQRTVAQSRGWNGKNRTSWTS